MLAVPEGLIVVSDTWAKEVEVVHLREASTYSVLGLFDFESFSGRSIVRQFEKLLNC